MTVEPNLLVPIEEILQHQKVFKFLGIRLVGIEEPLNIVEKVLLNGINLFSRITLRESEGIQLKNAKQQLQKNRLKYDLIAVEPHSAGLAALAARDGRVDAVRITKDSTLKVFNTRYGRRLEEHGKLVELDLSCFYDKNIAKNLRPLTRILDAFSKCKLDYILTINPKSISQMRSYRGIQAIGRILGLTNNQTSVTKLIDLLKINKKKLIGTMPFPDVEVKPNGREE
ncbi:MAG: RNase P subunit p30 family protein [Candidatus Kariarchaeaceae archaeon]|jgi:RNase P/RNase MRP subunit p30